MIPNNTGVIPRDPQPGDFLAGGETGIDYEIVNPTGNWEDKMPSPGNVQVGLYFDGSTCTNHACAHALFAYIKNLLESGQLPEKTVERLISLGFIVNGKLMPFSPRYNAIKSGTKWNVGNYLYKPWDSARHDGMIPDYMLPFPRSQRTPPFTQEDYFNPASITPEMNKLGKAFLELFEIRYEIVPTTIEMLEKHKLQAPLAIITGVCFGWGSYPVVQACDKNTGHAVVFNNHKEHVQKSFFDSYEPNQKYFTWGYAISYAIKGIALVREQSAVEAPVTLPKEPFTQKLQFGSRGPEVTKLQVFLTKQGFFPASVKPTGYYGLVTQKAVLAFQLKNSLDNPVNLKAWNGMYWGAKSIQKANTLL